MAANKLGVGVEPFQTVVITVAASPGVYMLQAQTRTGNIWQMLIRISK